MEATAEVKKENKIDAMDLWNAFTAERKKLETRRVELKAELERKKNGYFKAITNLKGCLIENDQEKVIAAQDALNEAKDARDLAQLSLEALGTGSVDLKKFIAENPNIKASQELEVFVETALPEIEKLEEEVKYLLDVRIGKHLKAYLGRLKELREITTRYYDLCAKYNMAQDYLPDPKKKSVYKIPPSQNFTLTVEELRKELGRWPSYFGS